MFQLVQLALTLEVDCLIHVRIAGLSLEIQSAVLFTIPLLSLVRHSGYFGKGVNIGGVNVVGMDTTDAACLSEDAMASYGGNRQRA